MIDSQTSDFRKLERLARDGDRDAQFKLGRRYHLGEGVDTNYGAALKWYKLSADQGDARAKTNIAVMYRDGQGVKSDLTVAVTMFSEAAADGSAEAAFSLAIAHLKGFGVERSEEKAIEYCDSIDDKAIRKLKELVTATFRNAAYPISSKLFVWRNGILEIFKGK